MMMTTEINNVLLKYICSVILVIVTYFITKGLNSKKLNDTSNKLTILEDKEASSMSWLKFVEDMVDKSTVQIKSLMSLEFKMVNKSLDMYSRRIDMLESITRKIRHKLPTIKEPNGETKALIIEDDEMTAEWLTMALENQDIFVVRTDSVEGAINKLGQYVSCQFSFALVDIHLKDGLCDKLIDYCKTQKLLMSADGSLNMIVYSGIDEVESNVWDLPFLIKPFTKDSLCEKIRKYF